MHGAFVFFSFPHCARTLRVLYDTSFLCMGWSADGSYGMDYLFGHVGENVQDRELHTCLFVTMRVLVVSLLRKKRS
jgi:hypothetical protein